MTINICITGDYPVDAPVIRLIEIIRFSWFLFIPETKVATLFGDPQSFGRYFRPILIK